MARLKVLFRIPLTVYWLALAIYDKKKLFCIANKEFEPEDGKYYFYEITLREDIDIEEA